MEKVRSKKRMTCIEGDHARPADRQELSHRLAAKSQYRCGGLLESDRLSAIIKLRCRRGYSMTCMSLSAPTPLTQVDTGTL